MEAVFFVHGGGFYAQMQAKEKVSGVMKKTACVSTQAVM